MSKGLMTALFTTLIVWSNSAPAIVAPLSPAQRACSEIISKKVQARYGDDASLGYFKDRTEVAKAPLLNVLGQAVILKASQSIPITFKCVYNEDTLQIISAVYTKKPKANKP